MSILTFIEGYLEGNAWEELCVMCYTSRYQNEHYKPIPAVQGGDGGIEGFTITGIVHQCYCPEREYSEDQLYEHQRNKLTTDINKLLSPRYAERLSTWGVPPVLEWHFNIPEYKDSRILTHAETKRRTVLEAKKAAPDSYKYICDDFRIIIKTAEDFAPEISKIIRTNLTDLKLNLAIQHNGAPDWSQCDSDKVANIRRKIKAVMLVHDDTNEDLKEVIDLYIGFYISGLEIMNSLRIDAPEFYVDLYKLEQMYKKEVKLKTRMHTNRELNGQLFNEILNDFQSKLERDFSKILTQASIGELKHDMVASWLADCSMEFRSV